MYRDPVFKAAQMTGTISAILIVAIWLVPGIRPVVGPVQAVCMLVSLICIAVFVVVKVREMLSR